MRGMRSCLACISMSLLLLFGPLAAISAQAAAAQPLAPVGESHQIGPIGNPPFSPGLKPTCDSSLTDDTSIAAAYQIEASAPGPLRPMISRTLQSQHVLLRI
jgi:hypothetical protein